jgi:hypothetical protein
MYAIGPQGPFICERKVMTKNSKIIVLFAFLMTGFITWLSFTPGAAAKIASIKPLPILLAVLGLSAIYPLYLLARRWPHLRVGIGMLVVSIILSVIVAFLLYSFQRDGFWVHGLLNLSQVLFVLSNMFFVWQSVRRLRR